MSKDWIDLCVYVGRQACSVSEKYKYHHSKLCMSNGQGACEKGNGGG